MRWENTETPTFAGSAGSNGEPAVVETMNLYDRDGNVVAAINKSVAGATTLEIDGQTVASSDDISATELGYLDGVTSNIQTQLDAHYPAGTKIYRATLTQASTAAPTITLLQNTLGQTVTAARSGMGIYTLTAGGAVFTANKTQVFTGVPSWLMGWCAAARTSTTVITLTVADETMSPADGGLTETAITIVVFP